MKYLNIHSILKFFQLIAAGFLVGIFTFLLPIITSSKAQSTNPEFNGLAFESVLAATAKVEKVKFTVNVLCAGQVQCSRGLKALIEAERYIQSKLDIEFQNVEIFYSDAEPQGTLFERWKQWANVAVGFGAAKRDLTVIFLEDFPGSVDTYDFEEEGVIGLASDIGDLGISPSCIFVKVMGGQKFLSRIVIHEIGHVLGAEHVPAGIMHPSAGANQYADEYALYSIAQIKAHLELVKKAREAAAEEARNPTPPAKEEDSYIGCAAGSCVPA